jgi:catechol 2,3-dioxygenase-like lactoylglutathione lyase family enzyme
MAKRKPRRAARAARPTRAARPARTSRKGSARRGARAPASGGRQVPRQAPENLRLRAIEPSLTVNDIDQSLRYYSDVLGFHVADRWMDGAVLRGAMLKAGACGLGLSQDDWSKGRDRQKGQGISLWFKTAQDIDALASRIKAAGGLLVQEPKAEEWGGRSLVVDDPDGFRLRIYAEK